MLRVDPKTRCVKGRRLPYQRIVLRKHSCPQSDTRSHASLTLANVLFHHPTSPALTQINMRFCHTAILTSSQQCVFEMGDSEMNAKLSAPLFSALFALLHLPLAFGQQTPPTGPQWDGPGPWHMGGGGWGFWWIFPLFMLLMMVICFGVFFFGHHLGSGHRHWVPWQMMDRNSGHRRSDPIYPALQILNERFARGEIEKAEYEEKKAIILSSAEH